MRPRPVDEPEMKCATCRITLETVDSAALLENDVRRLRRRHVFNAPITKLRRVDAGKQVLSAAKQDRGDGKMHLVDQSRTEILPDCRDAAHQLNILVLCNLSGTPQRCLNAIGHEMKCCAPFHRD